MTVKVKAGLHRLKTSDLIAKSLQVESKMTGNALYANPTPTLADITAARVELEARAVASAMGDRQLCSYRRDQEEVLRDLLRRLAAYVKLTAHSDSDVLSSGFDVYSEAVSISRLSRPSNVEAKRSDLSGKVELSWKPVRGSQHYLVEMAVNDPETENTSWTLVSYSSRSKLEIDSLTPGSYYWFRVLALGAKGSSGYSGPAMVMAA